MYFCIYACLFYTVAIDIMLKDIGMMGSERYMNHFALIRLLALLTVWLNGVRSGGRNIQHLKARTRNPWPRFMVMQLCSCCFFVSATPKSRLLRSQICQGCKLVVFQEGMNRKKGRFCQTSSLSFGKRRVLSKVFLCWVFSNYSGFGWQMFWDWIACIFFPVGVLFSYNLSNVLYTSIKCHQFYTVYFIYRCF